jgi:hypothetical protein
MVAHLQALAMRLSILIAGLLTRFRWSSVMCIVSSKVCCGDAVLLESDFAGRSLKSVRQFLFSGSESRELASKAKDFHG